MFSMAREKAQAAPGRSGTSKLTTRVHKQEARSGPSTTHAPSRRLTGAAQPNDCGLSPSTLHGAGQSMAMELTQAGSGATRACMEQGLQLENKGSVSRGKLRTPPPKYGM